jgi:hypothetical protein
MVQLVNLDINSNDRVQSAFMTIQASGSGINGFSDGIHLRWDLLRSLGENHLPKGNLAADESGYFTTAGFNKNDDFVQVFRIPYQYKFKSTVDFRVDKPTSIQESSGKREWWFTKILDSIVYKEVSTTIVVRFSDVLLYDQIRATVSPKDQPEVFIQQYDGLIEFEAKDKLSFAATIRVKQATPAAGRTRVETISVRDHMTPDQELYLSKRQTYTFNSSNLPSPAEDLPIVDDTAFMNMRCYDEYQLMVENINYVRFDYQNLYPVVLSLETYQDFITGASGLDTPWESVGANNGLYGLSLDTEEVYRRLDNTDFDINGKWSRFLPSDAPAPLGGPQAFKVNVSNYQSKWSTPGGVNEALGTYLELSKQEDNLQAIQSFSNNESLEDATTYDFNYLTFLRYIALDFHFARMMGLGTIDTEDLKGAVPNRKFIYLAVYKTENNIEGIIQGDSTHYYMTLPTGKLDEKVPVAPVMTDLSYGLTYDKGTEEPILLTDSDGYARNENVRYINIGVEKEIQQLSFPEFFVSPDNFHFTFETEPVFYGIEYSGQKSLGVWEDFYRVPKLSVDDDYFDANGNKEIIPLINVADTSIVYTHNEREQGIHRYAVYAINWFSRFSSLSTPKETDETLFNHQCILIPPANFTAHLIQEEDPLIFTTEMEQARLAALSSDKTLVRLTYEINDAHHAIYQLGNKVQFFFKSVPPISIAGLTSSVQVLPGKKSAVSTKPLILTSQGKVNGQYSSVDPVVTDQQAAKFVGSLFATPERQFRISEVVKDTSNANRARFTVDNITENGTIDSDVPNEYLPYQQTYTPEEDVKFFATENMASITNWERKLTKEIEIINFSPSSITLSNNTGSFTPISVQLNQTNTDVILKESISEDTVQSTDTFTYTKKVPGLSIIQGINEIIVQGDLYNDIPVGTTIFIEQSRILTGNISANGGYSVVSVKSSDGKTTIRVNNSIPDSPERFIVSYVKSIPLLSVNISSSKVTVKGNIKEELLLTHSEVGYYADGDAFIVSVGGIYASASVRAIPDTRVLTDTLGEPILDIDGNEQSEEIPGSVSGVYEVIFDTYQLNNHPDNAVEWYNGKIRIPVADANSDVIKTLEVIQIKRGPNISETEPGAILQPLTLLAYDPEFDTQLPPASDPERLINSPLQVRANVLVNFHPGYRVYLTAESADAQIAFDQTTMMPGNGIKEKQTFISSRCIDTYFNCASNIAQPTILLARKIFPPVQPYPPTGPVFATRPDFYGKSTYTFDLEYNTTNPDRVPYAFVFYRSNSINVLSTLYKPSTLETLRDTLDNLSELDQPYINDIWIDFMNVELQGNVFKQYPGGFRFPNPDNSNYVVPNNDPKLRVKPFAANGTTEPGSVLAYVKEAINLSFNPLTEKPVVYPYLVEGIQTRNKKPVIKDGNGEYLLPSDPTFDPFPMAVKIANTNKVRFTDYTLDGASNEVYFYYAMEMNEQLKLSDRSTIVGPVRLVNSIAADPPIVRKITTQLANPILGISSAVKIEVDKYIDTENIKKLRVYRTYNNLDAQTVRNMKSAIEVEYNNEVLELVDDFSDESFVPYGEILYYRVVGLREILNEDNQLEYVPSEPSKLLISNIVDVINPSAPELTYTFSVVEDPIRIYRSVQLNWTKTVHNGIYYIYKMTSSGNWTKVGELKSNDNQLSFSYPEDLIKIDSDGNEIYHRFRVDVQNSSGLLNLETKELTI